MPRRRPSTRPSTQRPLGDRALDALTDPLDDLLAPRTADPTPSPTASPSPEAPPPPSPRPGATTPPRLRLSTEISAQVLEGAKDAVFWTPGMTLAGLVEEALSREVERRVSERGEPFPARTAPLPPGYPVR